MGDPFQCSSGAGRPRRSTAGFTLTELIIVISIVAVMVAFATPSLVQVMNANRVATEASGFVADLHYARSEAVRQGVNVTLCPSTNGTQCAGGQTWHGGWIIFADPNANRSVDSGEMLIRRQPAWTGSDTLTAQNAATESLSFSRDGFLIGLTTQGQLNLRTAPVQTQLTRCIRLTIAGRQQVVPYDGTACQ